MMGALSARVRVAWVAALATLMVILGLAAGASPAHAWTTGNVWVTFGPWNCPRGGSVVGVYWAVDGLSAGPAGGDWGDNIIYPTVRVGLDSYNTLRYELHCQNFVVYTPTKFGYYTYPGVVGQQDVAPFMSGLIYAY